MAEKDDWTDDELRASVEVYAEMYRADCVTSAHMAPSGPVC